MSPVLQVDNLTVSYSGQPALIDVSFSVQARERVAIVGPNGAEFGCVTQRSAVDWSFPVTVDDVVRAT